MSKTPKRKSKSIGSLDLVGKKFAVQEFEIRRAARHRQRVRKLNSELTRAIRAADKSSKELHAFLTGFLYGAEGAPQQQALPKG